MCPFHLGVFHSQGGSLEEEVQRSRVYTAVVAGIVHIRYDRSMMSGMCSVLPQCIDCDEELQIKTTTEHAYGRVRNT